MNFESIQLINTAIIKSQEKNIDPRYEQKLNDLSQSPALEALDKAITELSSKKNITRDQAAIDIVQLIRDLDKIWQDYVMMEGIDRLKTHLKSVVKH